MCEMKKKYMSTLDYYNENAQLFAATTASVDFSLTQARFATYLPQDGSVLDFGCGSGRDTKYFLSRGFQVTAADGSEELCKFASQYAGIPVKHMLFHELDDKEQYDGIWACSSILHLPLEELIPVLEKMAKALKPQGIIYTSFKYGNFAGERNGRYFTDMTEISFAALLQNITSLKTEEQWITSDVRPERGDEKWLNVILRKK